MEHLSYFISFIQSFGPTWEEVAEALKEGQAKEKNFKMQLNNHNLDHLLLLNYNEPLYYDMKVKTGLDEKS